MTNKFYLTELTPDSRGFVGNSLTGDWEVWLIEVIPRTLHIDVRRRLYSNLKHILVGLEMKAGMIVPHGTRARKTSLLFEPYFQTLNFEFCVGVFSVCEGIGAALYLHSAGDDGQTGCRVNKGHWTDALIAKFDAGGDGLRTQLEIVTSVRNKIHQDRLGLRDCIDWHALGYENSFIPAKECLDFLLNVSSASVPDDTNLAP